MSLCKLSFQNVRKSIKDYTVYFLTLMLGVCLFYLFNALDSQALVQGMSEIQQDIVQMMVEMMAVISVFISVVLGCLILYANRYLVKRRKKEFGIYMPVSYTHLGIFRDRAGNRHSGSQLADAGGLRLCV